MRNGDLSFEAVNYVPWRMKIYAIPKHPWFGIEGLTTLAYRMGVVKLKFRPVMWSMPPTGNRFP